MMTIDSVWLVAAAAVHLAMLSLGHAGSSALTSETCVAFESSYHFERACECVVFESFGGSEGTFTSANFPFVYPVGVSCILYTFIGDLEEIVELTFVDFDLQTPTSSATDKPESSATFQNAPPRSTKCSDFVKLFLDLERPEVSDQHSANHVLCGNISSIQKTFYSSKRSLILEFHTDSFQANNSGFRGVYRFLDKGQFETVGGTKRWETLCTFDFYSNKASKSGRFFSPKYPQSYPPNSNCQYFFYGEPDERVEIELINVQLKNNSGRRCSIHEDVIKIRDGIETSSPILRQFCGTGSNLETVSSGENASLEFSSNGLVQRQGFASKFKFVRKADVIVTKAPMKQAKTNTDPTKSFRQDIGDSPYTNLFATAGSLTKYSCDLNFTSEANKKSGTISSPFYPKPYPPDVTCHYVFQGQEHERIQIVFVAFALKQLPPGMAKEHHHELGSSCDEDVDSLSVSYMSDGDYRRLDLEPFCLPIKPPPKMIMSPGRRLFVTFTSKMAADPPSTTSGFLANYTFMSDFGIKTGDQVDSGCNFVYRSNLSISGSFTSPNYGGLYPRNTECNFLFFGADDQRINITFLHFDVEGIQPGCLDESQSDFVELSNFNLRLTDRKMTRMCGGLKDNRPQSFISDGNFFRVTFKTNDLYDASGFNAIYLFRNADEINEPKASPSSSSSSASTRLFYFPSSAATLLGWSTSLPAGWSSTSLFGCMSRRHLQPWWAMPWSLIPGWSTSLPSSLFTLASLTIVLCRLLVMRLVT